MPTVLLKPIADGTVQRTGSEGFYRGEGESTDYKSGPPYYPYVNEYPPDDSDTWLAWAVENDGTVGCGLSFIIDDISDQIGSINHVKVIFRAHPGQDSGNEVDPEGEGNIFNIGVYYNGIEYVSTRDFRDPKVTTWTTYTHTFTTKQDDTPWLPSDFPLEPMLSYGRYWTTEDKDNPINDNAHNMFTAIYLEISYEEPGGGSSLLLNV